MSLQFGRKYKIQVDTIVFDNLDVEFHILKSLKKDPNTLDLTIYNLNKDHRRQLESVENPIVQIEAGYEDNMGVIYLGLLREVSSVLKQPDWVTTLTSGDGEKKKRNGRVNKSFAAGTKWKRVLKEVAKTLEIETGNLDEVIGSGKLIEATDEFSHGVVVSGQASKEMDRLIRSAGLEWSIQDGAFQILEAGKALAKEAIVLTPNTGLIGSPTVSSDGILTFTALLNPNILPGKQIHVFTDLISGFFRCEKIEYTCHSRGNDWYVQGEATRLHVLF